MEIPLMRIRQRRDRHFIDERGRLFWINGPDDNCYLSEQRTWRSGLSFEQVLEWKQCAPSGLVSQRFPSPRAACEAFEQGEIRWFRDLYLRRMGDQMAAHRGAADYKPTAMKLAEAAGEPPRTPPWQLLEPSGPAACAAAPAPAPAPAPAEAPPAGSEMAHPLRRRRSGRQFAER